MGDFMDAIEKLRKELRENAQPGDPFHPDTPWHEARDTNGVKGAVMGFCPTQGEGTVDGLPWYYRSRHGEYRFAIAYKEGVKPHLVDEDKAEGVVWHGDAEEWEPVAKAWETIERHCRDWRMARGELL